MTGGTVITPLADDHQLDRCRRQTRPDSIRTGHSNPVGPVWK